MGSRLIQGIRGEAASPSPVTHLVTRAEASPIAPSSGKPALAPHKGPSPTHFFIEDYVELLGELLARGARFETLEAPDPARARAGKLHYVKHDIHHDLDNTLRIARAEREIGIRSTFFMMHENPINRKYFRAPATWEALRRIQEMGHLLALHVDGFVLISRRASSRASSRRCGRRRKSRAERLSTAGRIPENGADHLVDDDDLGLTAARLRRAASPSSS